MNYRKRRSIFRSSWGGIMRKLDVGIHLPLFRSNVTSFEERRMKTEAQTMRQLVLSVMVTTILLISGPLYPSAANGQTVKAFPTAEGYGANSVGGRGGRIIKVTNLNDSGPGSLRAALQATGPRIVVFTVSGTIYLTDDIVLTSANSFLTVAGQTSPGGIQIRGGPAGAGLSRSIVLYDGIHDVIIRYLRVRPGGPHPATGISYSDAQGNIILDGGTTVNGPVTNIIVDHSSFQWSTGKTIQNYNWVTNTTWQWNIIASGVPQPLGCAPDDCGNSFGALFGGDLNGDLQTSSIHHNLFVHFGGRVPLVQRSGTTDFVNNVIYNWGTNCPLCTPAYNGSNGAYFGRFEVNTTAVVNMVNNHYIAGPNTDPAPNQTFIIGNGGASRERGGTKIYVSGNWSSQTCPSGCAGGNDWNLGWLDEDIGYLPCATGTSCETKYKVTTPFSSPTVVTTPTANLKSVVTATVGAYKPSRDSVDATTINDVNNRSGNIANIRNGGPWPTLTGGAAPVDTDGDGIPDSWEIAHGLNPNDPSDGPRIAPNGYTNVENYLNELAGDPISGGGGSPPSPPDNLRVTP